MINQNRSTFCYNLEHQYLTMELIEMIGWIVLGFVPMLGGRNIVSRKLTHKGKIVLRTEMRGGEYLIGI